MWSPVRDDWESEHVERGIVARLAEASGLLKGPADFPSAEALLRMEVSGKSAFLDGADAAF